jgi:4-hydroxybutyrate CoA-transferase
VVAAPSGDRAHPRPRPCGQMRTSRTSARDALRRVPDGARIVSGGACATPLTLLRELGTVARERPGMQLRSGLQLGGYPFLDAVAEGALGYATWHVRGELRDLLASGAADLVPVRASEVPALVAAWRPDVALVRVSSPDRHGYVSLGPSVAYTPTAVRAARLVIAEVDEALPRTWGGSMVHVSDIDVLVDAEDPTPEYRAGTPDETSARIAAFVLDLLPRDPVLQMGIGGVPEALTIALRDADIGTARFVGMATDWMVDLFEAGVLDRRAVVPDPAILAADALGTRKLLDFCDDNPAVGLYPSAISHDAAGLGDLERFVSINSAVEVDLRGQVNGEMARGRQLSGVGGALDYAESAYRSPGGLRITVLPSTTRSGASRIVPALDTGAVTTVPRSLADVVVTEHGVARLRGLTVRERKEALVAIAHPDHRDELAAA